MSPGVKWKYESMEPAARDMGMSMDGMMPFGELAKAEMGRRRERRREMGLGLGAMAECCCRRWWWNETDENMLPDHVTQESLRHLTYNLPKMHGIFREDVGILIGP
jgi:hypothetical protein